MTLSKRRIKFRVFLLFILIYVFLSVSVVELSLSALLSLFIITYITTVVFFRSYLGSWKKVITSIEFIYEITAKLLSQAERKNNIGICDEIYKIGNIEYVNTVMQNDEVAN